MGKHEQHMYETVTV